MLRGGTTLEGGGHLYLAAALQPVSSIWSPLTRRRWWNHIGDDTALGGITSAMIRRQPDHLNCPSSYPFSPFSPFPFQSNPLARLRGAVPVWGTQTIRASKALLVLLCQQAAQASQTRARRWRVGQVPRSMVLRNTSSDTTPDTTSQTVASRDTLQ